MAHLVAIATFLKTPISYFFADCMEGFDWNSDEQDRLWQTLTQSQRALLVEFIKEIRKE